MIGGTILGSRRRLGARRPAAIKGPARVAPYQYGPGPYAGPPVAYACHYERFRDYDAYGYPIIVRRRVCD